MVDPRLISECNKDPACDTFNINSGIDESILDAPLPWMFRHGCSDARGSSLHADCGLLFCGSIDPQGDLTTID